MKSLGTGTALVSLDVYAEGLVNSEHPYANFITEAIGSLKTIIVQCQEPCSSEEGGFKKKII